MEDDPDSTQPKQPRYLRTLIQGTHFSPPSLPSNQAGFSPFTYHLIKQGSPPLVLVSGDAPQQQGALRVAESLVLTRPPDLNEVMNRSDQCIITP